jgi:cation transport regulator ChaB
MPNQMQLTRGSTPVPDPTVLSTAAIKDAIGSLREILEAEIHGQKSVFESRLDGMDKAIGLLQAMTDKQPQEIDKKICSLQKLHEEKFASIETQFKERDTRTEQTSRDSKVAVDAALQAQKEAANSQNLSNAAAITKSEVGFIKQIDQITILIATNNKATDDKIEDLKARLDRGDGKIVGAAYKENQGDRVGQLIFSVIGAITGIAGLIIALTVLFRH